MARTEWLRRALALCTALIGLGVLAGWTLDIPGLMTVLPGLTTMKANVGLSFVASGAALLLLRAAAGGGARARLWLAAALGLVPLGLGALTLVEYIAGVRLGIDELLFLDPQTTSAPFNGRMAPATAGGLVISGMAIVLLAFGAGHRKSTDRSVLAGHVLAAVPGAVGYLSLAGYAYGVQEFYRLGPFIAVALNTGIAFVLLALAMAMTLPQLGWRRKFPSGSLADSVLRRLIPVGVVLPFLAGGIVVWGVRLHWYAPLFAPVLFALAAAGSAIGFAWFGASAVRRAEARLAQTTAALTESEAWFRTLVTAMPQQMFITLPDGDNRFLNRRWQEFTGMPASDHTSWGWLDIVHPDDREASNARWKQALERGTTFEIERRLRASDGSYHWFLTRAEPLRDDMGAITHWFGTSTDISEIVAARETSAQSQAQLERLVEERTRDLQETQTRLAHAQRMEALGQLAGGIAHDFNNVMQSVLGAAAMIEQRADDPARVQRFAHLITEAAGRGGAITRRLLAFGRRGDLRTEAVDPAPLLTGLQEILAHTLGGGISVRVALAPGLRPFAADKGQVETVLVNLATNARDAMPGGGILSLAAAMDDVPDGAPDCGVPAGSYVRLSVADTGMGMAADVLTRATEPFFTTKAVGKGTGLGLAMARGFAEQSGGRLRIESAPDQGTVVTLWFPEAPRPVLQQPETTARGSRAGAACILMVDDDAMVLETLGQQMEEYGYTVLTAASGAEALRILTAEPAVTLLVTDLSMPMMDGLALIREAQRRHKGLPALLLTGYATDAAERAMAGEMAGRFTLLRKPITGTALAEEVARSIEMPVLSS